MSYKETYTEQLRINFLKFTQEAFKLLPKLDKPRVLDLGCGSGMLTLELANLTDGNIIGIDIDQVLLDKLIIKIKKRNLESRISTKRMDLLKNDFPDNYFDLIWEEGVVQIIGFKDSFEACYRILKTGGYFVLGQAIKGIDKNLKLIRKTGFELLNQIKWPRACWWTEYYKPLEKKIMAIRDGKEDPKLFDNISVLESEIKMVKANPNKFYCAHYILQKKGTQRK